MTPCQLAEQRRIADHHRTEIEATAQPATRRVPSWVWVLSAKLAASLVLTWWYWPRIVVQLARGWSSS